MLTRGPNFAYNIPVLTKKVSIGRRKPERSEGVQSRHSSRRLSGFFVRSYHFLTSEACGQLRAGRFLLDGISYPAAPRSPAVGSGCEVLVTNRRNLAMQEVSAVSTSVPTYNIAFIFQKIATRSLTHDEAKSYAALLRSDAKSLLAVIPDSVENPKTTLSEPRDIVSSIQTVAGLLEAADTLTEFSKEA